MPTNDALLSNWWGSSSQFQFINLKPNNWVFFKCILKNYISPLYHNPIDKWRTNIILALQYLTFDWIVLFQLQTRQTQQLEKHKYTHRPCHIVHYSKRGGVIISKIIVCCIMLPNNNPSGFSSLCCQRRAQISFMGTTNYGWLNGRAAKTSIEKTPLSRQCFKEASEQSRLFQKASPH